MMSSLYKKRAELAFRPLWVLRSSLVLAETGSGRRYELCSMLTGGRVVDHLLDDREVAPDNRPDDVAVRISPVEAIFHRLFRRRNDLDEIRPRTAIGIRAAHVVGGPRATTDI